MNQNPDKTAQIIYLKGVLMTESITSQVAKLQKMTVFELRSEWEKVFGKTTKQTRRSYLWKRLARKLQEDQLPKLTADEEAEIKDVKIYTEELANEEGNKINVSCIEIYLARQ